MSKDAVVVGYSGHAYVVVDVLRSIGVNVTSYCEAANKYKNPYDLIYLGDEREAEVIEKLKLRQVFLGVGHNTLREKIYQYLEANQVNCPSAIHRTAWVSPGSEVGAATVIMPNAVINAQSVLGKAVICNSSSVVEHECILGDYVHIGPGAVLAGNVKIGHNSFIGAHAVIKEGVTVGAHVTIGAGSVVLRDLPDGALAYGNPVKIR